MHVGSLRSLTEGAKVFGALLLIAVLVPLWALPASGWAQDTRLEQFSPREEMNRKEQIRRNPRDANAWYYLGRFYDFTHRNQQAAEAFYQATLLKPGWAEAFFNLGKMYRAIGRHREAAQALQQATLLKSNFSRAFFYLGLVLLDLDRVKEAAAAIMQAYTLNPGYFETYFDVTSYGIHSELGDKDAVLKLVQIIYPENQQLSQILYKRWARHGINLREFYEVVSGTEKNRKPAIKRPRRWDTRNSLCRGIKSPLRLASCGEDSMTMSTLSKPNNYRWDPA